MEVFISDTDVRIGRIHIGGAILMIVQALALAFLLGQELQRLNEIERQMEKMEVNGTDALKIVAERQQNVLTRLSNMDKRMSALEQSRGR